MPLRDEVFVLAERSTYLCMAPSSATVFLGSLPLAWSAAHGGWLLHVSYWAADQVLRVRGPDGDHEYAVRAEPAAEKLTPEEWAALLADLDEWHPAVVAGDEGGHHGGQAIIGVPLSLLAIALVGTVRAVLAALDILLQRPRLASRTSDEYRRIHTVRRADEQTVAWLARHPAAALQMDWRTEERAQDPHVRVLLTQEMNDHPANRFIAGQLRRVISTLRRLGGALLAQKAEEEALTDAVAWSHARGARCLAAATALDARVHESWLGRLPGGEPTEAALSVVIGDPVYRRVHRLCDALLRPRWSATAESIAPVRPTFTLYELWAFFWLTRMLTEALPLPGRLIRPERLNTRTGSGAEWRAPGKGGRIRLCFNPRFPGWPPRVGAFRYSLTGPRRPDFTLCVSDRRGGAWYALDAKYRVGRSAIEDAFTSAHVYRDALRWPAFGGAPKGAWLIVPQGGPGVEQWFAPEFHNRWSLGAIAARPGDPRTSGLPKWLVERLPT